MKVRIIVGAQAAYACIETDTTSTDIRLEPGRSAAQSLREFAEDMKFRADRLQQRAALAVAAAEQLEQKGA